MRFGLWGIALLVFAALLAQGLLQDHGYVLISFRGYVAELSVPGLILAFAVFYLLVRLLVWFVRSPIRLRRHLEAARTRRAGGKMSRALLQMAEGEWAKAERLLTRGVRGSQAPLAHYLLAARAAQYQGAGERRDEWLKRAYEQDPKAETPILLMRAELQFHAGEHAKALATLKRIARRHPNHPEALALHARVCEVLGDREQIAALLPRFNRRIKLEPAALLRIALPAIRDRFESVELTSAGLDAYWKTLPTALRRAPEAMALRAGALQRSGHGDQAERELRSALKRNWDAPLVSAYGEVHGKDIGKQLRFAEDRLEDHPDDARLLATVAQLCMASDLLGKARSYLESSLVLEADPGRYALYGQLLERIGEADRASLAFRSGLVLLEHTRSNLPALPGPHMRQLNVTGRHVRH